MEKRNCPFCQKILEIPLDVQKFKCTGCGKNLARISRPSLTKLLSTKDEIDLMIVKKIMLNFVMQLDTSYFIFKNDKEKEDRFKQYILEITQSLLKVNSHRRKYLESEKNIVNELIKENEEESGSYIGSVNPIELNAEFDGFLVHIKSALDSLAKTTGPLFGFKFENWAKKAQNGQIKSGVLILNSLRNNIGKTLNKDIKLLIKLIEDKLDWITFIVVLRDKPVHKGKSNASNLVFNPNTKHVSPQTLYNQNGKTEVLADFMEKTLLELIEFIHNFFFLSFNSKLPMDIRFEIDDKGDACWLINIPKESKQIN